jgi:hypothetical protein
MVGLAPPSLLGSGSRHCYGINYTQVPDDRAEFEAKENFRSSFGGLAAHGCIPLFVHLNGFDSP